MHDFQREFREKFDLGEPDIPLKLASPPKDKKRRKRSHEDQAGEDGPVKKKRKKKKKDEEVKNEEEGSKKKKEKKEKVNDLSPCWLVYPLVVFTEIASDGIWAKFLSKCLQPCVRSLFAWSASFENNVGKSLANFALSENSSMI